MTPDSLLILLQGNFTTSECGRVLPSGRKCTRPALWILAFRYALRDGSLMFAESCDGCLHAVNTLIGGRYVAKIPWEIQPAQKAPHIILDLEKKAV